MTKEDLQEVDEISVVPASREPRKHQSSGIYTQAEACIYSFSSSEGSSIEGEGPESIDRTRAKMRSKEPALHWKLFRRCYTRL